MTEGYGIGPDNIPDWLTGVPADFPESTPVAVGDTQTIPADMLEQALGAHMGESVVSSSMAADLAQGAAEKTGNPAWKNLPAQPSSVERIAEDAWKVRVGDYQVTFSRASIQMLLEASNLPSPEKGSD
jgi:hypothetical protein